MDAFVVDDRYHPAVIAGVGVAKEVLQLRRRFSARRAYEIGLVTELAPEGASLARALELAEDLVQVPPLAAALGKEIVDRHPESSREVSVLLEWLSYGLLARSDDALGRTQEFLDRRGADRPSTG